MRFSIRVVIRTFLPICIFLMAVTSHADIVKGPFTFADDAFVDQLVGTGGTVIAFPVSGFDLVTAATDTLLNTGVLLRPGAFIDLAFTDNVAGNGVGTDIVILIPGIHRHIKNKEYLSHRRLIDNLKTFMLVPTLCVGIHIMLNCQYMN